MPVAKKERKVVAEEPVYSDASRTYLEWFSADLSIDSSSNCNNLLNYVIVNTPHNQLEDSIHKDMHAPGCTRGREKPKRINFSLTPAVRAEFEETAARKGMSLTEYLRRAAFAAKADPSILDHPAAVKEEDAYKANLGPSRWTREQM